MHNPIHITNVNSQLLRYRQCYNYGIQYHHNACTATIKLTIIMITIILATYSGTLHVCKCKLLLQDL